MKTIVNDIKAADFKKVYLLYGEETYLLQDYKNNLIHALVSEDDTMNFTRYYGKNINIGELIDLCETMPFFADRRAVLLEDTGLFKNKCDELADYIKDMPEHTCLVFAERDVDKRNRLYKAVKASGHAAEFTRMDEKKLMEWAAVILSRNGRKISRGNVELLLEKTGTDMGNLRNELEKLIAYTDGRQVVTTADIEAICTTQISNRIFEMLRAVSEKNQKRALELYYDLLALKEPPMRILTLLSRQFRQMRTVKRMEKEGYGQSEIMSALKLQSFAVRNLSRYARGYRMEELEQAIRECAEYDEAIKTGRLDDTIGAELFIIKYSSRSNAD